MESKINYFREKLGLEKHPEGGFFKEVYRSEGGFVLQSQEGVQSKNYATSIYFLLTSDSFSAFHRIKSDELWHFYTGASLEIFVIEKDGNLRIINLGQDMEKGETFQAVVPANCWFASRVSGQEGFTLAGCTVAPGFEFADFEMAERADLIKEYPQHREIITSLTR